MIDETDFGVMVGMLALGYADPLFETSYLPLQDRALFRHHARNAIAGGEDASFSDDVGAWIFDWRGAARRFLGSYRPTASSRDARRVDGWVRHGFNGIYAPDLRSYLWHRAFHWAKYNDGWRKGLDPMIAERTHTLLWHITRERSSAEHLDAIEAVREHPDDDPDDRAIKSKTRIDFHDDFVDPLLLFTCMRGQFVMMETVRRYSDDAGLMGALNRIPPAWHAAEARNYPDHDFGALSAAAHVEELTRAHVWIE